MGPENQRALEGRPPFEAGDLCDPEQDVISLEGADRPLIRWVLTLAPTQRPEELQGFFAHTGACSV